MAALRMSSAMCSAAKKSRNESKRIPPPRACMERITVLMMLIALVMIGATPEAVKGARKCGLNNLTLTNEYVTTSICRFGVRNNCPCEAFNVVASCEDRRWNQGMINRFAMEVDVPRMGQCTLFPNALLFQGINYSRTYPCAGPLPLSLVSAQFGEAFRE
ncbi:hypothetical protein KP509_1Z014300 [Ceratopteris richardii]|nr:hypothetical protein KP509_1Z014300 [Ceratopteris richardii]